MRTFRLSKSRITAGLQCGKRLWLAVHRPELEAYSADTQRRFAAGHGVGEVARELYPGGVLIGEGVPLSQALRETEQALAQPGDVTLYEATFRHSGVLIRADILERRGGRCRMVEVKSATRLKEYHLQDIAIQGWVAEGAGVPLDGLSVAVIDTDYVYPGGGDYRGLLREIPVADQARPLMSHIPGWVRGFNELLAGPLPVRRTGTQCRRPFECPFVAFCEGQEGKSHCDPGEERDEDGACALPPDPALGTLDPAATAFLATLPYPRYYLDFETVQFAVPVWAGTSPFQQLVFQWSCHVEERPGEVEHREFLDTSGEAPMRQGAEALLEALGDQGPIFVYHDFEKWRIMEMAAMLPDLAPALERRRRPAGRPPAPHARPLRAPGAERVVLAQDGAAHGGRRARPRPARRRSRTASPRRRPTTRPSTRRRRRTAARRCARRSSSTAAWTRSRSCAWRTGSRRWRRRDPPHRDRRRTA